MSQNNHRLLLFFTNEDQIKSCYTLFKNLEAEASSEAQAISQHLGIDISKNWNEDWFNQSVSHGPNFVRLTYDTSTGYDMPLEVLQQLFAIRIKAACLEVFHDQVGEFSQFYFVEGRLISRDAIFEKYPKIEAIIDKEFECEADQLEEEGYSRPQTIKQLIKDKQQQEKEARDFVDGIQDLAKLSRDTGENPLQLVKSAMLLSALGKGLLHAVMFGVVTILLFKGLWLWISLTVLLLIALPLIYITNVNTELGSDDEEDEDSDSGKNDMEAGGEKC